MVWKWKSIVVAMTALWGCRSTHNHSAQQQAPSATPSANNAATTQGKTPGVALRQRALHLSHDDLDDGAESACGEVYGVVYDMPITDAFASLVAFCDGNMSLYTTTTFGIIGGIGHENIRQHSRSLVALAAKQVDAASKTSSTDYPTPPAHRIYILTRDGRRSIDIVPADLAPDSPQTELFEALQKALAALRQTTQ